MPNWLGALTGSYRGPFDITQYYFYAGLLLVPMAALGVAKNRVRIPALAILVTAVWYMLGPAAGFYRLGAILPGLHSVRAPIQGWFVAALVLAMLAAAGAASASPASIAAELRSCGPNASCFAISRAAGSDMP